MITKLDITKILAENKYKLPLGKFDTAIWCVDASKAADLILQLINNTSHMKKYAIVFAGLTIIVDCKEPIQYDKEANRFHVIIDGNRFQSTLPIVGLREITVEGEGIVEGEEPQPKKRNLVS